MKTYFITTFENGDGIEITTDDNFSLTMDYLFINPKTKLVICEYLFNDRVLNFKASYDEYEFIKIEEF